MHSSRRICAAPRNVSGWAVSRRYPFLQHTEILRQLRSMVRGMWNTPPENPDALAFHVEELRHCHPPLQITAGKEIEAPPRQLDEPVCACRYCNLGGQNISRSRLGRSEEFSKEAALR